MEDEYRLLDTLIDRFPDSVWVGRTAEGNPFGFMAVVPLHRETAALLERHRAGAVYLKRCPPEERTAVRKALDVDASVVRVYLYRNALGGVEKIVSTDNGHGINHVNVESVFGHLGGCS